MDISEYAAAFDKKFRAKLKKQSIFNKYSILNLESVCKLHLNV